MPRSSPVEFHVGLVPDRPVYEVVRLCAEAEALGFAGVWVAESQSIFRDAHTALAASAGLTTRVALATAVTNPVTRHPAVLANEFATLDELSGGRAVLGIGVGESSVRTLGLPPARLAELERTVAVVRALVAGEEVEIDGHVVRNAWSSRRLPVYIASSGPRSLRLAARIADGILFQVGSEPSLVRWALRQVEAGADGRTPRLLMRMACAVDRERAVARDAVAGYAAAAAGTVFANVTAADVPADVWAEIAYMKEHYDYYQHASNRASHRAFVTERILDTIAVAGTPEYAIERFRELCELPIDGFVLPMTGPDPAASMRLIAEEVLPQL